MRYAGTVNAPDIPAGLDWLNTDRPLSIRALRGKIVLLDFWTYCCINCLHILPDLKKLEQKYAQEVVVIGVHSAKFTTERDTAAIREAILRYDIDHPVVNDYGFTLWKQYGVRAWPTLMLIDPAGKVIGSLSGEGVYEPLDEVIAEVIAQFDALGTLDRTPLSVVRERDHRPVALLDYPGKVIADAQSNRLFIADSGHHRIVVCSLAGEVLSVIGSGREGAADGPFGTASFCRPQGLALDARSNVLYIADTDNHLIRRADLHTGTVTTLAGTGAQARRYNEEGRGTEVALNSPWDLALIGEVLYIAMAGPHQLWTLDLHTLNARVYAGSGREDLIDAPLRSAALAQPSGITTDGTVLYIADSETSAVRTADLAPGGRVHTLVGRGLFDFGDIDGGTAVARLQHPLGVLWHDGVVYVADTYNHRIKCLHPVRGTIQTVVGTGTKGYRDGTAALAQLFEPGGLAIAGTTMYIADTNNHCIRTVDMASWTVSTLRLAPVERLLSAPVVDYTAALLPVQLLRAGTGAMEIALQLPEGAVFNTAAPFVLEVQSEDTDVIDSAAVVREPLPVVRCVVHARPGQTTLRIRLVVYYCGGDAEALCYLRDMALHLPVAVADGGADTVALLVDIGAGTALVRP